MYILMSVIIFLQSGNIFVFTGMLDICENDDQLGIVLAHEIAHTLLDHAVILYIYFLNSTKIP